MGGEENLWGITVVFFAAFLLLQVFVDFRTGAFQSEFGRNPDEGIHFTTGVLVHDFLKTPSAWFHPMAFARDFYAHYPKIGLGQWPPLFEMYQACWSLLFGYTRGSMMVAMAVLSAFLATLTARTVFQVTPRAQRMIYAALAGSLLVLAPLTQEYSTMTMAEVPLSLLSLASILAWIRFEASGQTRDTLLFGLVTSAAILTKGNAWLIPPAVVLAIAVNGSWRILRRRQLWIAAALVAALCVPFTLATINIVRQGMNTPNLPTLAMVISSTIAHTRFVADLFGTPMLALAVAGVLATVGTCWLKGKRPPAFWTSLLVYGTVIILFHAVVPTSFEPRKVYQITPVLCVFLVAGVDYLVRVFAKQRSGEAGGLWHATGACAALVLFLITRFVWITPFQPGTQAALAELSNRAGVRGSAILISSNGYFQDMEAGVIAGWISSNSTDGTYLIRATKLLARLDQKASGLLELAPAVASPDETNEVLARVPVAYVLTHTTPASRSYEHHQILQSALSGSSANGSADWELFYQHTRISDGRPHRIELFRNRKDLRGLPVRFEIDLTRKINQSIQVDSPGAAK